MIRIAINGFGRIGKMALRNIIERDLPLKVVAINDLTGTANAAHLFQFDSTYGQFKGTVEHDDESITINGKRTLVCADRDPTKLPWKELDIDIVLECTGVFRTREKAALHLQAGAKKVIISAPAKDEVDATIVMGVNENELKSTDTIISNASCTTNCLAPVAKVLHENFGIINGLMNTIHAYTANQNLLDSAHKHLRRARSAPDSIIPTSTGAAKAVGIVIPELNGKIDGFAMRVPLPTVSTVDFTFESEKELSFDAINKCIKNAAEGDYKGIIGYEERPLVSIDYRGDLRSGILDAPLTRVMGKNFAKVVIWYDNEWGYANRLIDLAAIMKNI